MPQSSPEPPEGWVALVTGGDRGLGLRTVRSLAEQGMRVVLASRSAESGLVAVELLGDLADRVAVRQLDVTDPANVTHLTYWLRQRLGRCDVLVNNASVLLEGDDTATTVDLDVVRRTLEINLLGTWRMTQAVAPLMRAFRYGRIVNLTGTHPDPRAYRISKSAVDSLTRVLAAELAQDGILVNSCCPEPVDTGAGDGCDPAGSADTPVWLATLPDDGPTGGCYLHPCFL